MSVRGAYGTFADTLLQLSTVTSLTKMLSAASTLPDFTPALGHTYLPPTSKNPTPGSSFQNTQTSPVGTPIPTTSMTRPDAQETTSTKTSARSKVIDNDVQSSQLLATSFDLFLRYGNEYMDENPIVGEPGAFKLSKARDSGLAASTAATQPVSQPFKASTIAKKVPPLELKTDIPPEKERKGSGSAKSPTTPGAAKRKKERRKSRAAGVEEGGTPKGASP